MGFSSVKRGAKVEEVSPEKTIIEESTGTSSYIHITWLYIYIYTYVISSQSGFKSSARSCLYKTRNGLISILIWTDLMCIYIIHYTYILFKNILIDAFITTTIITIMGSFVSLSRSPPLFVANGVPFSASLYIIIFFSTILDL